MARDSDERRDDAEPTRRTFLRATGALGATLPFLTGAGSAAAQGREDGVDVDVESLVEQMTLDEKVRRTHGTDGGPEGIAGYVAGVERLGVPGIAMADGPPGASLGSPTTDFPHPVGAAATFRPSLVAAQGRAIAREAKSGDVNVLLAPSMDLFRVPLHARAGETYGEDPFLSAAMAAEYAGAVQSEGVVATLKHFVCYNQASTTGDAKDYFSYSEHNVVVDERPLRELYFAPFRAAVERGNAGAVMPAYNKLNGTFCSQNAYLLEDVLEGEWGFDGFVVSDWGGTHSTVPAARNGLDVEMPSATYFGDPLKEAVRSGDLSECVVNDMVRRGLRSQAEIGVLSGDRVGSDPARGTEEHFSVARRLSEEGSVLLKNEGVLPLDTAEVDEIALVGPDPESFKSSVGGSDSVTAVRRVGPVEGIEAVAGDDVTVTTVSSDRSRLVGPDAVAPTGDDGDGDGSGFTAEYFPNADWSGDPARTRAEDHVDLTGSDLDGVDAETVSVRWSGTVTAPSTGTFALSLTSQGASTLYVDGEAVVVNEGGGFAGPKTEEAALELEAGEAYEVRVEAAGTPPVTLEWNPPEAVEAAADAAGDADVALVLARTDTFYGDDRHEFELPGNQNALVEAVADANEDAVVLLNTEAPVAMPWVDAVPGIFQIWFPGQEGGRAVANLLFGEVNPSGKTPVTFAESLEDYLPGEVATLPEGARGYPGVDGTVYYDEGVFVGYRHFDEHDVEPLFPFGHGLSYTEFEYSNLRVTPKRTTAERGATVRVDVTNVGDRDGAEAVQVYVGEADPAVARPPKELAGVAKADVPAGETETVEVELGADAFRYWSPDAGGWTVDPGEFRVLVGASSRDVRGEATVRVAEAKGKRTGRDGSDGGDGRGEKGNDGGGDSDGR